jgi:ferredoxin
MGITNPVPRPLPPCPLRGRLLPFARSGHTLLSMTAYALCHFSGTGNTERVSCLLAEHLGNASLHRVESILSAGASGPVLTADQTIVLLYPVYALDAPPIMYRFLTHLCRNESRNAPSRAAIITVPCDPHTTNSAAVLGVRRRLERWGCRVVYENQVVMPANILRSYPEPWRWQLLEGATGRTAAIARDLAAGVERRYAPSLVARTARGLGKLERLGDNLFGKDLRAGPECNRCGTCISDCPVGNIRLHRGGIRFGWACIMCMRCLYRCPNGAIRPRLFRFWPLKEGYDPQRFAAPASHDPCGSPLPERFRKYLSE